MQHSVFNKNNVDFTTAPMFFGEPLNTQRYDVFKYPIFDKLTETQHSYFWRPQEISLQKDRNDFNELREEQKRIFTANLKYQTLLDSVQGRSPAIAMLPYCSLPELESCITAWVFFENIHSKSYTYIVKNLYANPSEVFDTILSDKMILERASSVTKTYDDFIQYASRFTNGLETDVYKLKKLFWLMLVNINILEGIRFYVSFACTFAFGEIKLMEGSAKIIGFIARDESQHLAITQNIIKCYKTTEKDEEMLRIISETESEVEQMYINAVNEEKRWAKYLFEQGSMVGLNEKLLCDYIEWIANKRLRNLGMKPIYDISSRNNPLPWTEHWLTSKNTQNAPQETEIESYVIGGVKQDLTNNMIEGLSL